MGTIQGIEGRVQKRAQDFTELAEREIIQPVINAINDEWKGMSFHTTNRHTQVSDDLKFLIAYEIASKSPEKNLTALIDEGGNGRTFTIKLFQKSMTELHEHQTNLDGVPIAETTGDISSDGSPKDSSEVTENILRGVIIARNHKKLNF